MSEEAVQVPPGRYSLTILYQNDGGPLVTGWQRRAPPRPEACSAPAESIWVGTVETAPVDVEIVDRPPTPHSIQFPTSLELSCKDHRQLYAREVFTGALAETVFVRPGYNLGWRGWDAVYVDDATPVQGVPAPTEDPEELEKSGDHPNARVFAGMVSGSKVRGGQGNQPSINVDHQSEVLARGTRYRLRRKIVAFEYIARSGDRLPRVERVLAARIVEAPWTMESVCR
jgi:hypothetical protein